MIICILTSIEFLVTISKGIAWTIRLPSKFDRNILTMVKLFITDLDDTLYSWLEFFVPALYDMAEEVSRILGIPEEQLLEEYKLVH